MKYDNIPTFEQAAQEAGMPTKTEIDKLVGIPIVVEEWEPGTAYLPGSDKTTEGYWVICKRIDNDENLTFFAGQVAILKALKALNGPFRTTIHKDKNAYQFK